MRRQPKALHRLLDLGLLDKPEHATYRIHRLVTTFARQAGGDHTAARNAAEQALLDEAIRVPCAASLSPCAACRSSGTEYRSHPRL